MKRDRRKATQSPAPTGNTRRLVVEAPSGDSERLFWLRLAGILLVAAVFGALGVAQVRHRSAGIGTAYELARMHDELREQVDSNRRDAARLTGRLDPTVLRREAEERFEMRVPPAAEPEVVDTAAPRPASVGE